MWTTSSSPAERRWLRRAGILFAGLAMAAVASACAQQRPAPNTPRPARDTLALAGRSAPSIEWQRRSVELRSLRLARVRSDSALVRLAGPVRLQEHPTLIALIAETADSIPVVARNAALEIYIGGERAGDTWVVLPNRLVAFVADSSQLRPRAAVTAAWTGAEAETRSRSALILTEEHLQAIR